MSQRPIFQYALLLQVFLQRSTYISSHGLIVLLSIGDSMTVQSESVCLLKRNELDRNSQRVSFENSLSIRIRLFASIKSREFFHSASLWFEISINFLLLWNSRWRARSSSRVFRISSIFWGLFGWSCTSLFNSWSFFVSSEILIGVDSAVDVVGLILLSIMKWILH